MTQGEFIFQGDLQTGEEPKGEGSNGEGSKIDLSPLESELIKIVDRLYERIDRLEADLDQAKKALKEFDGVRGRGSMPRRPGRA